jgi:heme-degrading monooxygenase HmoA
MYPIGTLQAPSTPVFPFEVILECCLARAEDGTSMFVILWEFEVKPGSEERFERAYGPNGQWVQFFQHDPHSRGTQLRRDPARPLYYFTIDIWDSEAAYNQFLAANRATYAELDRNGEELTVQERHILTFSLDMPGSASS